MKKKRMKRWQKVIFIVVPLIILFQLTSGCFSFRMSQKEVNKYFEGHPIQPEIIKYEQLDRRINYAAIGYDSLPTVIFLHGAPGSWSAFKHFLKDTSLTSRAKLVSVDRPGYGHSDFGNSVTSLEEQSALLQPILKKYSNTNNILVGHSLGGPMIARLAMDYPDLVDGLIFVAASVDPTLEPNEDWFRAPLHTPFLRWILPVSFRVTNDEIYFLEDELEEMVPLWEKVDMPVTVIQGKKDNLVPAGNADFIKKMTVNTPQLKMVIIEDMNHFVPWNRPDLIYEALLDHISRADYSSTPITGEL